MGRKWQSTHLDRPKEKISGQKEKSEEHISRERQKDGNMFLKIKKYEVNKF